MTTSLFFALFLISILGTGNCFQSDNEPLKKRIIGHWKEDELTRTNLNNFLIQVGVPWIRRQIATGVSWENDMKFKADGPGLELEMTNGPLKTQIYMRMNPDDPLKSSKINIGVDLGGIVEATSEIVGDSLICTMKLDGEKDDFLVVTRTINPKSPNEMVMTAKHVPTGEETSSIYRKIN